MQKLAVNSVLINHQKLLIEIIIIVHFARSIIAKNAVQFPLLQYNHDIVHKCVYLCVRDVHNIIMYGLCAIILYYIIIIIIMLRVILHYCGKQRKLHTV